MSKKSLSFFLKINEDALNERKSTNFQILNDESSKTNNTEGKKKIKRHSK